MEDFSKKYSSNKRLDVPRDKYDRMLESSQLVGRTLYLAQSRIPENSDQAVATTHIERYIDDLKAYIKSHFRGDVELLHEDGKVINNILLNCRKRILTVANKQHSLPLIELEGYCGSYTIFAVIAIAYFSVMTDKYGVGTNIPSPQLIGGWLASWKVMMGLFDKLVLSHSTLGLTKEFEEYVEKETTKYRHCVKMITSICSQSLQSAIFGKDISNIQEGMIIKEIGVLDTLVAEKIENNISLYNYINELTSREKEILLGAYIRTAAQSRAMVKADSLTLGAATALWGALIVYLGTK